MFRINNTPSSTLAVRTICLVIFLIFSFLYLYKFQGDIYAVSQHILSDGKTSYNNLVGAIVLTAILYCLHIVTLYFVHLRSHLYALSYTPSFLLLILLTYINSQVVQHKSVLILFLIVPLMIAVIYVVYYFAKSPRLHDRSHFTLSILTREMWNNILIMTVLMFATILMGNSDRALHNRMNYEHRVIIYRAEVMHQQKIQAEKDSLRQKAIDDSIKAVKDSIREREFKLPIR
ncbi:MAG: hypothetical protein Q4A15_03465 [Prevotellaceae bacterium]|nr:hypothetical protein [Prevotellaceae bacterium]